MLSNERFALECLQRYAESGDIVDATSGQFAHCPQPERYGDKGYYLTWEDHQHQGLLQSRDIGECCFFVGDAKKWLLECDPIPEGYFELWDIYEEYAGHHLKKLHQEKDEFGRSLNAMKAHKEKDDLGRSMHAVKTLGEVHAEKDERGKSVLGVKNAKRAHAEKDERGKSKRAVKMGRESAKKLHSVKNEEGKSLHAMETLHKDLNEEGKSISSLKGAKKVHEEKDEQGRSVHAVRNSQKAHAKKDERGKSVNATKGGKIGGKIRAKTLNEKNEEGKSINGVKGGKATSSQVWESLIDGFRSGPGQVARHNKANGWDPAARVKIV
jgi:hypothetical protein